MTCNDSGLEHKYHGYQARFLVTYFIWSVSLRKMKRSTVELLSYVLAAQLSWLSSTIWSILVKPNDIRIFLLHAILNILLPTTSLLLFSFRAWSFNPMPSREEPASTDKQGLAALSVVCILLALEPLHIVSVYHQSSQTKANELILFHAEQYY